MSFIDVLPDGLKRFSEWHEEVGISRSMAYQLLKLLAIEPEMRRVPGSKKPASFLTAEQQQTLLETVQLVNQGYSIPMLQEMRDKAKEPANTGSEIVSKQSQQIVPTQSTELAVRPSPTPSPKREPLAIPRALAEAADLNVPLSNAEMAAVLGLSGTELDKSWDGDSPRPGFVLNRLVHRKKVFWTVQREGKLSGGQFTATAAPQKRTPGFDVSAAIYDVAAVDVTGSDLFNSNRIGR